MAHISVRIDDNLKQDAEEICKKLGLTLSSAITIYLVKLVSEKRIPFSLSVEDNENND